MNLIQVVIGLLAILVGDYLVEQRNPDYSIRIGVHFVVNQLLHYGSVIGLFVGHIVSIPFDYIDFTDLLRHMFKLIIDLIIVPVAPIWGFLTGFYGYLATVNRIVYLAAVVAAVGFGVYSYYGAIPAIYYSAIMVGGAWMYFYFGFGEVVGAVYFGSIGLIFIILVTIASITLHAQQHTP